MAKLARFRWMEFAAAACVLACGAAWAQSSATPAPQRVVAHDGQHDFDYLLGSWRIHLKKLVHPLSGSNEWLEYSGTVTCRTLWDGRAQIEEFKVDNPEKQLHIEGLALRLYNPQSHQWSIYWATPSLGAIGGPPVIGEFRDGRGEFYNQESFNGRSIYTRYVWTNTATSAPHFEQQYSPDGGRTWETNWITEQTRVNP